MKRHTFKDRLEAGLLADGWSKDSPGTGYRTPGWTKPGHSKRIFVGSNGGLRTGHNVSSSYSIGQPSCQGEVYKNLLKLGDERLKGVAK